MKIHILTQEQFHIKRDSLIDSYRKQKYSDVHWGDILSYPSYSNLAGFRKRCIYCEESDYPLETMIYMIDTVNDHEIYLIVEVDPGDEELFRKE